jgi:hypothetical protein
VASTSSGLVTFDIGPGTEIATLAAGIPGVGVGVGVLPGRRVRVGVGKGVRSVDVMVGRSVPEGVLVEVGLGVDRLVSVLEVPGFTWVAVGETERVWLGVGVGLAIGLAGDAVAEGC